MIACSLDLVSFLIECIQLLRIDCQLLAEPFSSFIFADDILINFEVLLHGHFFFEILGRRDGKFNHGVRLDLVVRLDVPEGRLVDVTVIIVEVLI